MDFEEFFFNDVNGIGVRFREHDYYLSESEKEKINEFIDSFEKKAKANNAIGLKDFQLFMEMIDVLHNSGTEECAEIVDKAFMVAKNMCFKK